MSRFLLGAVRLLQQRLNLNHTRLIHIEGGLGSQILGVIAFWSAQEKFGIENVHCNVSYFRDTENQQLWPWALDGFGIHLSEFEPYERNSSLDLLKSKKDYLTDAEIESNYWSHARNSYQSRFEILSPPSFIDSEVFRNFNIDDDFAAVHIRRGDYLQVASKIIGYQDYVTLIRSIKNLLPSRVVLFSDSSIPTEVLLSIRQTLGKNQNLEIYDSPEADAFELHFILRNAKVLITANSTFSFTAGLLGREDQTVFSPLNFHKGIGSEKYNRSLRISESFTIWPNPFWER